MYDACMFQNDSNFPFEQSATNVQFHDTNISNTLILSTILSLLW